MHVEIDADTPIMKNTLNVIAIDACTYFNTAA